PRVVDDYRLLPTILRSVTFEAERDGFVTEIDAGKVGVAAMMLGAGRERAEDPIDHAVGVRILAKPGEKVTAEAPVFEILYNSEASLAAVVPLLGSAFTIADSPPPEVPLVVEEIA